MNRFKEQVVIVTGASFGLGRCTAKLFASEGAKVVGIARTEEALKELKEEIAAESGIFEYSVGDLTEAGVADTFVKNVGEKYGRIDVLVNNAGADDFSRFCLDMTDEIWNEIIALNLTAPMQTSRAALRYMVNQESGGRIVNVGSIASLKGLPSGISYVSSKHGLIGLTKNIARAYAEKNIRCNVVCPAAMQTRLMTKEYLDKSDPKNKELCKKACATAVRIADPDEVARAIAFLASNESSCINGAVVTADSGLCAG